MATTPDPATTEWVPLWDLEGGTSSGGGGGGGPHHTTHEASGTDRVNLDASQIVSGTINAARIPATAPAAHHTTHEPGGVDSLTNAAWTNQANVFTQSQKITSPAPAIQFTDTTQAANLRLFQIVNSAQGLYFQATDDAVTGSVGFIVINRAGTIVLTGDIQEKSRVTAMGHWIAEPYNAANFTVNPTGTWTVSAANVRFIRYTLIGKTMTLNYGLSNTTVTSAATELRFPIPGGYTAAVGIATAAYHYPPATAETGVVQANANYISLQRAGVVAWGNGTVHVQGSITFEIV